MKLEEYYIEFKEAKTRDRALKILYKSKGDRDIDDKDYDSIVEMWDKKLKELEEKEDI